MYKIILKPQFFEKKFSWIKFIKNKSPVNGYSEILHFYFRDKFLIEINFKSSSKMFIFVAVAITSYIYCFETLFSL